MKEVSIYIVTGIRGRWQQDGHIGYAANTNRGRNAAVDRIPGADRRKKDNTDSADDTGTLGRKDRGRR